MPAAHRACVLEERTWQTLSPTEGLREQCRDPRAPPGGGPCVSVWQADTWSPCDSDGRHRGPRLPAGDTPFLRPLLPSVTAAGADRMEETEQCPAASSQGFSGTIINVTDTKTWNHFPGPGASPWIRSGLSKCDPGPRAWPCPGANPTSSPWREHKVRPSGKVTPGEGPPRGSLTGEPQALRPGLRGENLVAETEGPGRTQCL